tara:strand:+ start:161 stop:613 length:453 start_codon:yes stop_codon:yes gene_type:complete
MKKLLGIVVLVLLWSGKTSAEIINIKCEDSKVNIPVSVVINTNDKNVSFQGSAFDPYHLDNDIFYFSMMTDDYRYSYALNRNTGILRIKGFQFSKEEFEKILTDVYVTMVADGKTIDDKSYLVKLINEKYDEKEPETTIFMECEKSKAKF